MINVGDSRFFNTQKELGATIQEQQQFPPIQSAEEKDVDFQKPHYSLSVAHTLSVASKLAYEDVAVVKYELEKAGFDVEGTFKPIGYKASNKYVYVTCEKKINNYVFVECLCLHCGKG